jgi:transposase
LCIRERNGLQAGAFTFRFPSKMASRKRRRKNTSPTARRISRAVIVVKIDEQFVMRATYQ